MEESIEKIGALFPNCVTKVKNEDGDGVRTIDLDCSVRNCPLLSSKGMRSGISSPGRTK